MNQPSENKKRIVSKGQYVQSLGKRIGIGSVGAILLCLAVLCAYLTVIAAIELYGIGSWQEVGWLLLFCTLTVFLSKWGLESVGHAETIMPGIPFTRQAAASLSAEESLVRSSEESVQEQQAVLLRAATENQATPSEQLVKPVGGQIP